MLLTSDAARARAEGEKRAADALAKRGALVTYTVRAPNPNTKPSPDEERAADAVAKRGALATYPVRALPLGALSCLSCSAGCCDTPQGAMTRCCDRRQRVGVFGCMPRLLCLRSSSLQALAQQPPSS